MSIKNIVFEFSRVTESAAISAYRFVGRNDKDSADKAAVEAMRLMLNIIPITGEIVIGEGEMDEAPMLYKGEKVGVGGLEVDIAVDPIDGTKMVANGTYNAISVIAAAKKGCMLKAPDMYMKKLIVGPNCKNIIDIRESLTNNVIAVAKSLNKDIKDICVAMLDRPRHQKYIEELTLLGVKIFLFSDGDITPAVQACEPDSDIDIMYGIGGAPEGVIAAAAVKALGGDIQGQLIHYDEIWPSETETIQRVENEKNELMKLNLSVDNILSADDLIRGDDFIFSATGITKGDLLDGVICNGEVVSTHTLLVRAQTMTIRKIRSKHTIKMKPADLKNIMVGNNE